MKVCLMCEGSYPFVSGGVSSWVHMLITSLKDIEFCVSALTTNRENSGNFKYKMPPNLTSVHEIYLQDNDLLRSKKKARLSKVEKSAFRSFIMGTEIDWEIIFNYFLKNEVSLNSLLMGRDILDIIREFYDTSYFRLPFTDFLWTYRSMLLPLCTVLKNRLPEADLYHSASTGYSGILGCMAKYVYKKPLIITEHGIYTREREEEIIKSDFFVGDYKDIWIQHFYKMSSCAYKHSDKIISLFHDARKLQIEIGCDEKKALVIPNGVDPHRFDHIPPRKEDGKVNLGLIARVSPIKDIKTLITAFAVAKDSVDNIVLYIMGGVEESSQDYYEECLELIESIGVKDIIFTGNVNINEYMGMLDIILLTSISEGQPIAILEAMSAAKPVISTRVGNCEELLLGGKKGDLPCGIVTAVMNVEQISNAIIELSRNSEKRMQYGENGKKRLAERYPLNAVIRTYDRLYQSLVSTETDSS